MERVELLHDLASVGTGGTVSVLLRFRWRTLVCSIQTSEGGGVEELWIWWRGTAGCCLETMATDYDTTAC